jgi:prepilin-type N-terminal cleavage/methylation domain-containing protein
VNPVERRGVTLAELLIALTLLALIGSACVASVVRHSRSGRASVEIAELRDQLRDGAAILTADLASISAPGGDIYPGGMGKSSLEFRATVGSSVACATAATSVALPPNTAHTDGRRFTFMSRRVDPGHGLMILDEGASPAASDDIWLVRTVTAVSTPLNPCVGSPFSTASEATLRGYLLSVDVPLSATVAAGAPVRIVERARYALYQSGDNRWYLGYCSSASMATACAVLQPVSGPYSPANPDQASGLSGLDLFYHDADGAPTADPLRVARIDVVFRAASAGALSLAGGSGAPLRDSTRLSINLYNR